ncbi:mitochondrial chaperone bcs1 [Phaeosphaeriaceae sp. PMI808]|nr:mitochondrial chaperone bcs1 [Phaeosphaeriaceae sp. PMI808]
MALSIVECFGLDIYAVRLSVDDRCLKTLFAGLPRRCIVLLEDVEVATSKSPEGMASLSTLLDVIDNVGDCYVLVMTTCYSERLDGALMQLGRVDVKTEFRLVGKETVIGLFYLAFEDDESVDLLVDQFAAKIPEEEFSPAEVLAFLIKNRRSPEEAIGNAVAWMARTRDERKMMQGES